MSAPEQSQELSLHIAGRLLRLLVPSHAEQLLDDPTVHARFDADEYMPYWAEVWPAGIAFAEYLIACSTGLCAGFQPVSSDSTAVLRAAARGEHAALELGAGVGVAGLALASAGWRIVLTDYDADALRFAESSARLNGITLEAIRPLDWRKPPEEKFHVILAAEVLYEERNHVPIARLIKGCLTPNGAAYIGDACRAVADGFPQIAHDHGLYCDTIVQPVTPRGPGAFAGRLTQLRVFRLAHDRMHGLP